MAPGLLPNSQAEDASAEAPAPQSDQPPYLARISKLPSLAMASGPVEEEQTAPDSGRLDQIEHALGILASVVARLAKEAQQSKIQLRTTEQDPGVPDERRVQRELIRSMQSRLEFMEERLERQNQDMSRATAGAAVSPETAAQIAVTIASIRQSLDALAKRRKDARPT